MRRLLINGGSRGWVVRRTLGVVAGGVLLAGVLPAGVAQGDGDPRPDLGSGWLDAEEASHNLERLAHLDKPEGFVHPDADPVTNPAAIGSIAHANSDIAFSGDHAFVGSYQGFNIYDVSTPDDPQLTTSVICPGGQGDMSTYGDLLFMSVEEGSSRVDCGTNPSVGTTFRGVRIFDVSDVTNPVQVAAVQACRGSHTHTLVTDPDDPDNIYVYVSGISGGTNPQLTCPSIGGSNPADMVDENGDPRPNIRFQIEVIKVPLAAPEDAEIVSEPRLFADPETGNPHGLWPGGNHGPGTQTTATTDSCHDITAYPEVGLAAGACEGNGILIDISDPVNPVRIDEVMDPNFAYWHSATFNNDGTKVIFTDEWGGGTGARCRPGDPISWGANAIFDIVDGKMEFASYYKLPVTQTSFENCVAHNGSLVPVPGRDILVQAWYQGGISVIDFTDSANPVEIAFFDRGPVAERVSGTGSPLVTLAGFWSAYYYNGHVYGTEIGRGFDVFALTESDQLAQAEIDVASLARFDQFNAQLQPELSWPASFEMVRAKYAQALRTDTMSRNVAARVEDSVDRAERFADGPGGRAARSQLRAAAEQLDPSVPRQAELVEALNDLANEFS